MKALLLLGLLSLPAGAQPRRNVLEALEAELARDRAYDDSERAALLAALRARFADYGLQVLDARRQAHMPVLLHVITEGSFDQASPERVADVAFAAWQAMGRGAPAEAVEGIALYGYRKSLPGERIAAWANGYRQLVERRVPPDVAADLVRLTMERDIDDATFNQLKWSLIDAVKDGFDAKDYATFLFGRVTQGERPGKASADARAAFRAAKRAGRKVELPPYEGVFAKAPPPAPRTEEPAPRASPQAARSERARAAAVAAKAARERRATAKSSAEKEEPASRPPAGTKLAELWPGVNASAHSYLGTPYVWGGTTRKGIDCSALTQNSYGENRVRLPRVSRQQWTSGVKVDGPLREGDLVFFNTMGVGVSHVGLLIDPRTKRFLHASSSRGVVIDELGKKYYAQRYLGARRVVD